MLKAIETTYNGYRFRSRLEARWACFLDSLAVPYAYEAEGYDLDGVWYLPDFWLPTINCWMEIKGKPPNAEEIDKAIRLARLGGRPVIVFAGEIDPRIVGDIATDGYSSAAYAWASCSLCNHVDLIDVNAFKQIHCPICEQVRLFRFTSPLLRKAYDVARSARFEHGEQPVPELLRIRL
jgi:hypothetical protein